MTAPTPLQEQLVERVRGELIPHYLDHGCPCAFPRFRHLVGFFHRDHGAGPVGCYETEFLVDELFRREGAFYRETPEPQDGTDARTYTCPECGSRYVDDFDQYSISFYRSFVRVVDDRAGVVGAEVVTPFPVVLGLYWFQQADADLCYRHFEQASVETFLRYMKELGGADRA